MVLVDVACGCQMVVIPFRSECTDGVEDILKSRTERSKNRAPGTAMLVGCLELEVDVVVVVVVVVVHLCCAEYAEVVPFPH